VRVAAGREPTPRVAVIDSQSLKTSAVGGPQGYDGAKKVTGRKRHIAVDTLGLRLAVLVTSAAVPDALAARMLLQPLPKQKYPRLHIVRADSASGKYGLPAWVPRYQRYVLELVKRPAQAVGWLLLPLRWVVERSFAWRGRSRIPSKDYERLTESSETQIRISAIPMMLRRRSKAKYRDRFRYKRPRRKRVA
jgi:putative transposase